MPSKVDVDDVFEELERIGAILPTEAAAPMPAPEPKRPRFVATLPPEVPVPLALPGPQPVEVPVVRSLDDVKEQFEALKAGFESLYEWFRHHSSVTGSGPSISPESAAKPGRKRRKPEESQTSERAVKPTETAKNAQLEAVQARIRARIRGGESPRQDDDEDDVPFVGQERALPDMSDVSSVTRV